ncbi:hypothetical protein [Nitrosarchaeum koreense]|uniref:Uncharacterized protein n=1 Tax=Nitrosarchaeum koreense MY1 TaxID=1001994 RepID=F9CX37_9ARCH|nr:hypothetical protein [Nitrosarchaeum koreense]EGP93839.1 hypothetical protein MY1_1079 [Nitrosarchaeum koreense MY1]
MTHKKSLIFLLTIIVLLPLHLQSVSAQNLDSLTDYSIKLSITPSHIDEGQGVHHIGYIFILSKSGTPITSSKDVMFTLFSDNSTLVSVPEKIILKANEEYASFDVSVGNSTGNAVITASLNSKTSSQKIQIGNNETHLPDDLILELNLPSDDMHVNSKMPFSVYLRTSDNYIIRAPFDVNVNLEYEKSLAMPNSDVLTIKKGEYYAWGTLETHQKVGNTFLRAIQNESNLDTAKSIKISSTLPASLTINVFPKLINADVKKQIDIFVSVVDSDGNPTITPEDIKLNFFSNDQYSVGDKLDDTMKEVKTVIKKGQFGYYLRQNLDLSHLLANDIKIGVSAEGYGIATDTFSTVGKSINIDNDKITEKDIQLFIPERIPSNATSIVTYQVIAVEDDDVDENGNPITEETEDTEETEEDEDIIILTIDDLKDGEFYPIQTNENYYADGYVKKLNVISGDSKLVTIKDIGKIEVGNSFGTATINSGQKSGPVLISASVQGVGSDSVLTEVVNTLEQKEARIFSPTGQNTILFDREGNFDVFLIAIDSQDRPKVLKHDSKYLVTPTNGIIEIKKDTTFAFATLRSDSFTITEDENFIDLKVVPIGEGADLSLETKKTFVTQPSSKMSVLLPMDKINANHDKNFGIVQIVDLQGNPIIPTYDVKSKITSSKESLVQVIDDAVIPSGVSYALFPIETTGVIGNSVISASAKGVIGTESEISTDSSLTKLKIFTSGLADQIPVDEPVEIKLFIDDENAESVAGASIKINTDGNSLVVPDVIQTGPDGSAVVRLTATNGPSISLNLIATAEGYSEGKDTLTINVDSPDKTLNTVDLDLPEWIVYVIIAAILLIGVLVVLFLKKSKAPLEEDWEEEEL